MKNLNRIFSITMVVLLMFLEVSSALPTYARGVPADVDIDMATESGVTASELPIERPQTDWVEVDWDEDIVLPSDVDEYQEELDLLLENGKSEDAKNLKPKRHKMSSDESFDNFDVPVEVRNVVEEYRENDGMFATSKNTKDKKNLLKSRIRSVMPDDIQIEKKDGREDHILDIRTAKLNVKRMNPVNIERESESNIRVTSKVDSVKRHKLYDVTIEGISEQVKKRGLSGKRLSVESRWLNTVRNFFTGLFTREEAIAEDITPLIVYYDGIEKNLLDNTLYYISQSQHGDGSFGQQTKYEETAETALLLSRIKRTNNTQFNDALTYLITTEPKTVREQALKARLMVGLGFPYQEYLDSFLSHENIDHGYGIDNGYESDIVTTLEGSLAMYTANYSIQDKLPLSLYYVLNNIPADGALKYRADGPASYYLINKTLQYLEPFKSMTVGNGEGINIVVQDKINTLLAYISSQFDVESEKLLATNDVIDEFMTFHTWQMYDVEPAYQNILKKKLEGVQYIDGSYGNSLRATTYAITTLGTPDLIITDVQSIGTLESRVAANFEITIENKGYAPSSDAIVYIFADDVNTGVTLNLGGSGVTIDPNQSVTISFDISDTNKYTGVMNMKFYVEPGIDVDYDNNWIYKDFNFAPASGGTPALPMYYVAMKNEQNNAPALNIRWQVKEDALRMNYVVLFREKGTSQWNMYGINNTWNGAFVGGFQEGVTYEVTVGVLHQDASTVTFFNDLTDVTMSGDQSAYLGGITGQVTLNNVGISDTSVWGYGGSSIIDEFGNFVFKNMENGTTAVWSDVDHLESLVTKVNVPLNAISTGNRVFTRLKPDTQAPVLDNTELRWVNNMTAKTENEYQLLSWGSDNIALKSGVFYVWIPSQQIWQYIGSSDASSNNVTINWYIPSDLPLESGYKIKSVLYDYRGNASNEAEWGPFEIINGSTPVVSVTAPNGGEEWYIGQTATIEWEADSFYGVDRVTLNYVYPNRESTIVSNIANTGSYEWTIPNRSSNLSEKVKIKVRAGDSVSNAWGEDLSDEYFSILDNSPEPGLPWGAPINITKDSSFEVSGGNIDKVLSAVDAQGKIHLIYNYTVDTYGSPRIITQQFYHSYQQEDGSWTSLEKIYENIIQTDASLNGYYSMRDMEYLIDEYNNGHIVWQKSLNGGCNNDSNIWYMHQDAGVWLTPENISNTNTYSKKPDMYVSGSDVHIVWPDGLLYNGNGSCQSTGLSQLHYRKKTVGVWSTTEVIPTEGYTSWVQVAQTNDNKTHIVFYGEGSDLGVYHIYKEAGGWSSPSPMFLGDNDYNDIAVGINNDLHFVFRQWYNDPVPNYSRARILYSHYDGATWTTTTEATPIMQGYNSEDPKIVVDNEGDPHLFWRHRSTDNKDYATWSAFKNGSWTDLVYINRISQTIGNDGLTSIYNPVTNKLGAFYGAWYEFAYHTYYNEADLSLDYFSPNGITGLSAESVSSSVSLNWDQYVEQTNSFSQYNIYRSTNIVSSTEGLDPIATLSSVSTTNYVDSDIVYNTDYYYSIVVVAESGKESKINTWVGPIMVEKKDPLSAWHFDELSWNSIAGEVIDSFGDADGRAYGDVTTINDPLVIAGRVGKFDGIDDYVSLPIIPVAGADYSISAWYNTTNISKSFMTLIGGLNGGRSEVYVSNGRPGCRVWDTADRSIYVDEIYTSGWHHVVCAVTYGATPETRLYVDGVLKKTTPHASVLLGGSWKIGKPGSGGATYFDGKIDEVNMYNLSINDSLVNEKYVFEKGNYLEAEPETLMGYWKMDESVWSGIAGEVIDSSIFVNHAVSQNGVAIESQNSKSGNSGSFDGIDDYIWLPISPIANQDYSISAWYNTTNISKSFMTLVGGLNGGRSEVYVSNGRPGCRVWDTADRSIYTDKVSADGWHQVVCAISYGENPETRLYVDGILKKTTPHASALLGGSWKIGKPGSSSAVYFDGLIDEVSMYKKSLSDLEVSQLYSSQ